ncbi:MAG: radical SAM protein [Myxococcales bacterium]|nr:radical SAM protein [Myxococcales bacterium]
MEGARRLDLKLGFACNNRCLFCAQGEKRTECAARPPEQLLAELRAARPEARGLVLTGGEPTLYKRLVPLVRAARTLGFSSIQLQTNGRLLAYPDRLAELTAAGVTEISPSLHGPNAEVHDALTQAPGSFDETSRGIANAVAAGLAVITNSVITRSNVALLPSTVELLADLGVRAAQLAFVHPVGTALELFDRVVPRLAEVVEPLGRARAGARSRGVRLCTEAIPLCFLRGMEDLAVEAHIPLTTVSDLGGRLDYSEWRVAEGKAHGPPCQACSARARCEGPWREYPERRGWDEMVPLES